LAGCVGGPGAAGQNLTTPVRVVKAGPTSKPNVIIILADDLGYGDLGCYGSTNNRTPALDRMACEGLKLTSYYYMSQLQAVRLGRWKLRLPLDPEIGGWTGQPKDKAEARLYDLETDIGERNNAAAEHPDVVAQLTALAGKARDEIGDYKVNCLYE